MEEEDRGQGVNSKEWQAIEKAAKVLGLNDRATLGEIKRAFHRLSKLYHPDTGGDANGEKMYVITAAYETLTRYCDSYRYPLKRENAGEDDLDIYDPEDWWRARFGQDPLWGGKKRKP
nr:DnaJ domain-containing protein [Desulfobulbus rhabdoformis]